jgi:hypothetical protein
MATDGLWQLMAYGTKKNQSKKYNNTWKDKD